MSAQNPVKAIMIVSIAAVILEVFALNIFVQCCWGLCDLRVQCLVVHSMHSLDISRSDTGFGYLSRLCRNMIFEYVTMLCQWRLEQRGFFYSIVSVETRHRRILRTARFCYFKWYSKDWFLRALLHFSRNFANTLHYYNTLGTLLS